MCRAGLYNRKSHDASGRDNRNATSRGTLTRDYTKDMRLHPDTAGIFGSTRKRRNVLRLLTGPLTFAVMWLALGGLPAEQRSVGAVFGLTLAVGAVAGAFLLFALPGGAGRDGGPGSGPNGRMRWTDAAMIDWGTIVRFAGGIALGRASGAKAAVVAGVMGAALLALISACEVQRSTAVIRPEADSVVGPEVAIESDAANVTDAAIGSDAEVADSGLPRFVAVPVHDPEALERISRFRSGVGHDYSDGHEACRSMKHYFAPHDDAEWSDLEIRAPFAGRVVAVESDWAGDKVELVPDALEATAFRLTIFHVVLEPGVVVGRSVRAAERLGRHVGAQTMSDVAVWHVPDGAKRRLVSYFDVLDEGAFAKYRAVGVGSRSAMVIGKEERDASPIACGDDGQFVEGGAERVGPEDWVWIGG